MKSIIECVRRVFKNTMSTRMETLWKASLKTFTGRNNVGYKLCQKNFEKLCTLINEITAEDVKVTPEVLRYVQLQSAPMCVINIFENQDITIAIFILKHGVTMPIHDHPGMHGLLKVLSGTVQINSYTIQNEGDCIIKPDQEISAINHAPIMVNKNDAACILTPQDKNLHEIACIEGPAAFLDILSPPYLVDVYGEGERPCTYFKGISSNTMSEAHKKSDKVQLVVTDTPPDFYSRSLSYNGPPLS